MDGQVLGGGVIVLVAVLLWLVYLLPSWHNRHQYDSAERNAVRLNQALRVLAETSETPGEVRLELNARTALAQQKLARRAQQEQERADLEEARRQLAAARALPAARMARARRRARLVTTVLGLAAASVAVWGGWEVAAPGYPLWLWTGIGLAVVFGLMLVRMVRVDARSSARGADTVNAAAAEAMAVQDVALAAEAAWTPRSLPRPLVSSTGSRAAAVLDGAEALRESARQEALRARAAELLPPSIAAARRAHDTSSPYSGMGYVDDAEIEAHVRGLLARRRAG